MIRFTSSRCDKGLRAEESMAGSIAKCPSCGHKVLIPAPHPEPIAPEDAEPRVAAAGPPARRRKRKWPGRQAAETDRGRRFVIIIIGVVLGMHLLGLIHYWTVSTQLLEAGQNQTRELFKDLDQDLPKEFDKTM